MMNRKSACAILCPILLLLAGCIVVPFTLDDDETLATIEHELVVGVSTRDSVLKQLGQPDAIYELGRLWVFADADLERGTFYIDLASNSGTNYFGKVLFLISEFDDQGVLSHFRLEQAAAGTTWTYNNCSESRFCYHTLGKNIFSVFRRATDTEEAIALSFADPGEQCEVYSYTARGGPQGIHTIVLNGQNMGTLGSVDGGWSFFHWRLEPGEHQIDVYYWSDAERKELQASRGFACRAGERLFFAYKRQLWRPPMVIRSLVPVDEAKGMKNIKARRMLAPMSEGPPGASSQKPQSDT